MSKNNTIRKSDKKFIRLEKARIRAQFFDVKKQEEMINELYKRFIPKSASEVAAQKEAKSAAKVEKKKAEVKPAAEKDATIDKEAKPSSSAKASTDAEAMADKSEDKKAKKIATK